MAKKEDVWLRRGMGGQLGAWVAKKVVGRLSRGMGG